MSDFDEFLENFSLYFVHHVTYIEYRYQFTMDYKLITKIVRQYTFVSVRMD